MLFSSLKLKLLYVVILTWKAAFRGRIMNNSAALRQVLENESGPFSNKSDFKPWCTADCMQLCVLQVSDRVKRTETEHPVIPATVPLGGLPMSAAAVEDVR